jgi:hypothetical protein
MEVRVVHSDLYPHPCPFPLAGEGTLMHLKKQMHLQSFEFLSFYLEDVLQRFHP